jgi:ribosome biogenesis GTPase A
MAARSENYLKQLEENNDLVPIKLITKDKNNNLVIDEEGLKYLESIENSLAVCVIAGPYRQGKSFLLNRICQSNSFKVGHTDEACTKGISLLKCDYEICDINNEKFNLILLDTEVNLFLIIFSCL